VTTQALRGAYSGTDVLLEAAKNAWFDDGLKRETDHPKLRGLIKFSSDQGPIEFLPKCTWFENPSIEIPVAKCGKYEVYNHDSGFFIHGRLRYIIVVLCLGVAVPSPQLLADVDALISKHNP
jgi:hypothetical protein